MLKRNRRKRPPLPVVAIVGDGFCEQIYFQQMREVEGIRHIQIKPELPNRSGKGGGFQRVFGKAKVLKEEGYDEVFCLVDMDVVWREGKAKNYQFEKKRLENLGVKVVECNPCFEIWFLLHFLRTGHPFDDCGQVERTLRQKTGLADYSKEQGYFARKNLYLTLRQRLHTEAIPNAVWLEAQQDTSQSERFPRCEMFKIVQALLAQ